MRGKRHVGTPPAPKEVKPVVEEVKEEIKEAPVISKEPEEEKDEEVEAIIDGVQMSLNIRKNPEIKANNQIAVLSKGTKIIVINPKKVVNHDGREWYKVKLSKNAKNDDPDNVGYAMKKYIKVL